ncbi:MAG: UTRA domain-containing protein, partial [Alphaproteobacteria bacterium]
NPSIAPHFLEQDFTVQTPTEYLVSIAPVGELEHVVRACLPTAGQQELLDVGATEPCLMLDRRSWSWDRVASVVTLTYPASRYELRGRYRTSPTGNLAAAPNAKVHSQ